jgi:hypothetical protein
MNPNYLRAVAVNNLDYSYKNPQMFVIPDIRRPTGNLGTLNNHFVQCQMPTCRESQTPLPIRRTISKASSFAKTCSQRNQGFPNQAILAAEQ